MCSVVWSRHSGDRLVSSMPSFSHQRVWVDLDECTDLEPIACDVAADFRATVAAVTAAAVRRADSTDRLSGLERGGHLLETR